MKRGKKKTLLGFLIAFTRVTDLGTEFVGHMIFLNKEFSANCSNPYQRF